MKQKTKQNMSKMMALKIHQVDEAIENHKQLYKEHKSKYFSNIKKSKQLKRELIDYLLKQ